MVFYCSRLVFRGFHGSMWVLCFFSVSGGFSLFFMVPGGFFMVPGGFFIFLGWFYGFLLFQVSFS